MYYLFDIIKYIYICVKSIFNIFYFPYAKINLIKWDRNNIIDLILSKPV